MIKDKTSKIYDLNEYGEPSIYSKEKETKGRVTWQARFLKIMIALLLITVILVTIFSR
jgi:hypothetical protein